jgi:hypothetical protein
MKQIKLISCISLKISIELNYEFNRIKKNKPFNQ